MSVICGWCGTHAAGPRPSAAAPVSHGLCRSCLDQRLRTLPPPPVAPAPLLAAAR